MSKYHKYIVYFFILICCVFLSVSLLDNKPIKNAEEIYLNLDTKEYMYKEFNSLKFNNYESNFIKENGLKAVANKGRNIYYGSTHKEIIINNKMYFASKMSKNDFCFDSYHFKDSNIMLIKFDVNLYDFRNHDYYFEATTNYDILGVNYSYYLNESEYGIESMLYLNNGMVKKINDEHFKYKEYSKNPSGTLSIFIEIDKTLDYQGFLFTLYQYELITEKKSVVLGLNEFINTDSPVDKLLFINTYLELGGKD